MSTTRTEPTPMMFARHMTDAGGGNETAAVTTADRPLVSVVVPAYNEAAVVQTNLAVLCGYLRTLEQKYDWEIVVVNDGSKDETSRLARAFAATVPGRVFVHDHVVNFGLGQALKFAFGQCRGEVIVTIDMDLSYSPDHIERLVDALRKTKARIVVASCYMPGGKVENVPAFRRWLSVGANRFLSIGSHGRLKTLTGMVRAYDARFLRTLDFYSMGMEVNSEILYKAMVLRARVVEIPATLRWHLPEERPTPVKTESPPAVRKSSMKVAGHILTLGVSGFLYRPILFFAVPTIAALALTAFCLIWAAVDLISAGGINAAVRLYPAAFALSVVGFLSAVVLTAAGLLSIQSKCYFEQMFHLGTTTYRSARGQSREGKR